MRFFWIAVLVSIAAPAFCQRPAPPPEDCKAYNDTSAKPPAKFNLISVRYGREDSYVLITDASGRRIGTDEKGKAAPASIPHAAFEDEEVTLRSTRISPALKPEEIVIQYPVAGTYRITVTGRKGTAQWVEVLTSTCGKEWTRRISLPAARTGSISQLRLIYDPLGGREPQLSRP
jgi:hypothetical protein